MKRAEYERQVQKALEYQRKNPEKKMGDILYLLKLVEPKILIQNLGEIVGEKGIIITKDDIGIDVQKYISIDYTGRNFYNFDWISQIAQILRVPKASMWCWTKYNKSKYMCIFKEFSLEQAQEIKDKLCNYPVEVQFRMRE